MTLHKLAGSGYTYLTKQVAAHDATEKRQAGLASYYEEKGESPGRWLGTGLTGRAVLAGLAVLAGSAVLGGRAVRTGLRRLPCPATLRGWLPRSAGRAVRVRA